MNIFPFTQSQGCACSFNGSYPERATETTTQHEQPHVLPSKVQTLACPTCGHIRFVLVPVEAPEPEGAQAR